MKTSIKLALVATSLLLSTVTVTANPVDTTGAGAKAELAKNAPLNAQKAEFDKAFGASTLTATLWDKGYTCYSWSTGHYSMGNCVNTKQVTFSNRNHVMLKTNLPTVVSTKQLKSKLK